MRDFGLKRASTVPAWETLMSDFRTSREYATEFRSGLKAALAASKGAFRSYHENGFKSAIAEGPVRANKPT